MIMINHLYPQKQFIKLSFLVSFPFQMFSEMVNSIMSPLLATSELPISSIFLAMADSILSAGLVFKLTQQEVNH